MIEVKNKLYIQRFFATNLPFSDLFKAITYTDYDGDWEKIPFYYTKIPGHTAHIDLTQSMDDIMVGIKTGTRNEIRRAEKEGCTIDSNYDYERFLPYYNSFCESKGIDHLKTDLHTLQKYDKILITLVKKDDNILAMHATLIDKPSKLAMLMLSCSQRLSENVDRRLIGWGNRYLHYKEFEMFKRMGLETYEWNGVNIDPNCPERNSIGKFKLEFGGIEEDTMSLRTPLFMIMKRVQKMIKG